MEKSAISSNIQGNLLILPYMAVNNRIETTSGQV